MTNINEKNEVINKIQEIYDSGFLFYEADELLLIVEIEKEFNQHGLELRSLNNITYDISGSDLDYVELKVGSIFSLEDFYQVKHYLFTSEEEQLIDKLLEHNNIKHELLCEVQHYRRINIRYGDCNESYPIDKWTEGYKNTLYSIEQKIGDYLRDVQFDILDKLQGVLEEEMEKILELNLLEEKLEELESIQI